MQRTIYRGSKSFWKTKSSVEIAIVEHPDFDVLEIVVVDALASFEATRIFLDAILLRKIVARECQQSSVDESGELSCDKSLALFICNHLFIKSYLPTSRVMEVEVRSSYAEQLYDPLMVAKPAGVKPSSWPIEE
jgi:hypothetical protein